MDDTPITVGGSSFDPASLPPIPLPPLSPRSERKLSPIPHNGLIASPKPSSDLLASPKPSSGLLASRRLPIASPNIPPGRVASVPLPRSSSGTSSRRIRVLSVRPGERPDFSRRVEKGKERVYDDSTAPSNLDSPSFPLPQPERVIRVIRAAPKGFLSLPQLPDYTVFSEIEREALRTKYILNLREIRKLLPDIPLFAENEPLHIMAVKYDSYVRRAYIHKVVIKYKLYLTVFFIVLEAVVSRVIGFTSIIGYTAEQIRDFVIYEQILLEIAEKSKGGGDSEWPAEIRLVLLALMQAAFFLGINFAASFIGREQALQIKKNLAEQISGKGSKPTVDAQGIIEPPKESFDYANLAPMAMDFAAPLLAGGNRNNAALAKPNITQHKPPEE